MHVKRRLRRVLRGTGRHDRTAALLLWASVLGAPLLLDRFVVRRPAGRPSHC